jgi:hypothetical protein
VIKVAPLIVNHQGQFPSVTISFNLAPGAAIGEAVDAIQRVEKELHPPLSLQTSFQGNAQGFGASLKSTPILIAASLFVIYLILGPSSTYTSTGCRPGCSVDVRSKLPLATPCRCRPNDGRLPWPTFLRRHPELDKCSWMSAADAAPSPIAPPTRFTDPDRTSPPAHRPGTLDSRATGTRPFCGLHVRSRDDESVRIEHDATAIEPFGFRISADQHKQVPHLVCRLEPALRVTSESRDFSAGVKFSTRASPQYGRSDSATCSPRDLHQHVSL